MKSAPLFATLVLSGLTVLASAGQKFTFVDPISNGSYNNAMFQTSLLFPDLSSNTAGITNIYTGTVNLVVDSFTSTGVYAGSTSTGARYFLSKSAAATNNPFGPSGQSPSGPYTTGAGQIIFVDASNATLLRIAFTQSLLSYANFAAAGALTFSGNQLTTGETGGENASFIFPDNFVSPTNPDLARRTASFTASIGTVGTVPVPEPAPIAALLARRAGVCPAPPTRVSVQLAVSNRASDLRKVGRPIRSTKFPKKYGM